MPPEPSAPGFEASRRLHPSSVLFGFIQNFKGWVVPLLLALVFSKGDRWELWFLLLLVPSSVWEVVRYWSLRYRLAENELVVSQGVIFRSERHIPFERIQNIDLVQGPLQRIVGVAQVRVETASGSEPEAVLNVLGLGDVESMRERIFRARGGQTGGASGSESPAAVPAPGQPEAVGAQPAITLVTLSLEDVAQLGLILNRGWALILAAVGAAWEFDLLDGLELGELRAALNTSDLPWLAALVVAAAGLLACSTCLLSIAWTAVRLHAFRLERAGEDFRIRCGLFTRHSATIPRPRIQLVSVHENPLHRLLGKVSIQVETAGGAGEDEASFGRRWFAPLVARARVPDLLREIDPKLAWDEAAWQKPAPGYRRRMLRRAALIAVLVALVGAAASPGLGLVLLVLLLPFFLSLAFAEARFIAWARLPQGIAFRSGAWRRKTSATLHGRVQVVSTSESPFDRRYAMASLYVDTASAGSAGHKIEIPFLAKGVAAELREELCTQAERGGFRW